MSKAYDRVDWTFLKAVLTVMKFEERWIQWIMECVTSVSYTLLVNGNLTSSFKPSQGLRQGDPLSPYLFLFCANILSIALLQAENQKQLKGVKIGRNGLSFTHLLFADDSLFFFKKDDMSVTKLIAILDWYCSISGQKINLAKSDLYCSPNMAAVDKESLASRLHVNLVQNPTKYLGMTFKMRGNRCADFHFLVDKLHSRLQGWKAKLLSQAGRTTLISSVLQSLPLYAFSCFKDCPTLREGRWWIGDGYNIPLKHKDWVQWSPLNLQDHRLPTGTVGDLINHTSASCNCNLVRDLYPPSLARKIFQIPISKTNSVQDKLVWKHSSDGVYNVKKAYEILNLEQLQPSNLNPFNQVVWTKLWKVKTPLKINTFVWKLLLDSLPTFSNLRSRGILADSNCPFCNEHEETSTHLFLLCSFSRACWHGTTLAIHSSDFNNLSVQQWLTGVITKHNNKDPNVMNYLQALFTTLWSIWNHRNKVVHEGISPNPMNVILMAQSLSCRYKDAFSEQLSSNQSPRISTTPVQSAAGSWQLIIKVTGFRDKKRNRSAFGFEAVNIQGESVFLAVNSSLVGAVEEFLLEAVVDACLTAKYHGFHSILFLSDSRGLVKLFNTRKASDWQTNYRLADLNFLVQNGLLCHMILVPHMLLKTLCNVAKKAVQVPIKHCWLNPALL
ncbi:uncharacterized protein LOC126719671 [Quercus robur]|uniref:uncharacterized protein LOC126719671 n=1 Tax=Quercus robur TaxID=38942 RepID=UPI002161ECCF|nr:uncharacterized protein LOC126719671 [Quercus robur]